MDPFPLLPPVANVAVVAPGNALEVLDEMPIAVAAPVNVQDVSLWALCPRMLRMCML